MNSFSKKILSAFVDIQKDESAVQTGNNTAIASPENNQTYLSSNGVNDKFTEHFDNLFKDANLPGPDYYEFSKMTDAMQGITNEQARYSAAFAGLEVQGLHKQKLLQSAQHYVQLIEEDAAAFNDSIHNAFEEKVSKAKSEIEEAKSEMNKLSQQIQKLQHQVETQTAEMAESETRLRNSQRGYAIASQRCKQKLLADIDKINQHIL